MACDLDVAPFLYKFAFCIDEKGASLDTPTQFSIAFLGFHNVKPIAEDFFWIGNQREGQLEFLGEILMGFQTVPADTDNCGIGILECGVRVAEADAFCRTSRCVVFRIKINDKVLAFVVRQTERLDGGFSGKVWNWLVHSQGLIGHGNSQCSGLKSGQGFFTAVSGKYSSRTD